MRIVSLLPSATEIICALGLRDKLVGVTHECDFPPHVLDLPKVTQTLIPHDAPSAEIDRLVRERLKTQRALYTLDLPILQSLRPDLIVTQTLCDVCAVAEEEVRAAACALPGRPRVVNLEPLTLADVFATVRQVAAAAGVERQSARVLRRLEARVAAVAEGTKVLRRRPRVTLLEWIDPPFSCGHWSPELVRLAGGVEGLGQEGRPSRSLNWQEVCDWRPEALFIACCGFTESRTMQDLPILRSYPGWDDLPCVRDGRVYVVDGSAYFSRPGPRLVDSLEILAHALHPNFHPLPHRLQPATRIADAKRIVDIAGGIP
ncbi:MAG TPA: cobalamin-binding protein [Planctomycetales bacterium]|jgi:iron complex transport system substrate-binding protein|nr:cobalamin-binding protein [Planctomycetales bacterium]